jgi:hypothetical protein
VTSHDKAAGPETLKAFERTFSVENRQPADSTGIIELSNALKGVRSLETEKLGEKTAISERPNP